MSKFKVKARHAGLVLVGQLAVVAFGLAQTLIVRRQRDMALMALSVGSSIYVSMHVGSLSVVQALSPLWAK